MMAPQDSKPVVKIPMAIPPPKWEIVLQMEQVELIVTPFGVLMEHVEYNVLVNLVMNTENHLIHAHEF
jgi:hypothetical protein